ncbi:MAG: site-specific DNA-methyltransferase [Proteobacteria bacterium]|nr:site-specific DNA-methyltransferase [Pseudomonadota bacterium]MBU4287358.1 site-specific DNA-methyltransferase [Pseudomonadota bacterium]MCG2758026.1 site-specific DNA-methyltransferase [Desulfobacteraceae bacterium]
MPTTEFAYKTYFDEFEVESLVSGPTINYGLFETEIKDTQAEQLKVYSGLERGLPMFSGASFGNQVHFQNAYQTPVQRWFPYREGYSTRLVNSFIKELKITGYVFDPFSGSGTTLLASRTNNLNSFGIDVNPISVLVATVENEQYSKSDIKYLSLEIDRIKSLLKSNETFQTSFELAGKVFNQEILQSLLQLKKHIKEIENEKIKNLSFVAWLSIIEGVSNIKKEGNGIKYKNRKRTPTGYINIDKDVWEKQTFPVDKFGFVKIKLVKHLETILFDIVNNYGNCEKKPNIFKGSCLEFDTLFSSEIQFTFFSPPYCNCFDYFEIHKVDLWLGDFVSDKEDFRLLRNTGFRSNTNSLTHKPIIYKNENLENLISLFNNEKLWNNKIPNVVRGYFDDTHTLLNKLYRQTIEGGYVGIVVGNSAYSGVIIPSDVLIANIAKEIGFKVKSIFVTRHLTTSSQQKQELEILKNYLRESIVLLEK